jgi:hypothetical protein
MVCVASVGGEGVVDIFFIIGGEPSGIWDVGLRGA